MGGRGGLNAGFVLRFEPGGATEGAPEDEDEGAPEAAVGVDASAEDEGVALGTGISVGAGRLPAVGGGSVVMVGAGRLPEVGGDGVQAALAR